MQNVPDHFVCPLTLEVMKYPYRDAVSGRSYERSAILQWIWFGNATCPMSREPLHPTNFALNKSLMSEIRQWKHENDLPTDDETVAEETDDDDADDEEEEERSLYTEGSSSGLDSSDIDTLRLRILRRQQARIEKISHSAEHQEEEDEAERLPLPRVASYLKNYV